MSFSTPIPPFTKDTRWGNERFTHLWLLLIAIVCVTIFSKCSFLYPVNDWNDANCYFTVGKGMLKGYVPYRDLIDHKGLLFFAWQALGAAISFRSFFGIYCLEILAAYFFLSYSWKTLRLTVFDSHSLLLTALAGILIYGSRSFSYGNSTEEFALPLLSIGLYYTLLKTEENRPFHPHELLLMGIFIGILLWSKFTLLGLYVTLYLYFLVTYIRKGNYREPLRITLYFSLGAFLPTFLVLLYGWYTASLEEVFYIYYYLNIFGYHSSGAGIWSLTFWHSLAQNLSLRFYESYVYLLLISFLPLLYRQRWSRKWQLSCGVIVLSFAFVFTIQCSSFLMILKNTLAITFLVATFLYPFFHTPSQAAHRVLAVAFLGTLFFLFFITQQVHFYYLLLLGLFLPLQLSLLFAYCGDTRKLRCSLYGGILLLLVLTFWRNKNLPFIFQDPAETVQHRFAKIINASTAPTLLEYDMQDIGIYTYSGIVPNCPYFCQLQISPQEIARTQRQWLDEAKTEYVVTAKKALHHTNYRLIATGEAHYNHRTAMLFLYKKR